MFPGAGKISEEETAAGEAQLKKTRSHHQFHDQAENGTRPAIINPSRKRRIAAGSGTKVEDVNRLLKQFEQMQQDDET